MPARVALWALAGFISMTVLAGCAQDAIYEASLLPQELQVCSRTWARDALDRRQSSAEIRSVTSSPVVVERLDLCPAGACTDVAQSGPCHTVIFVRVGPDEYLSYSLQGGP